MKSDMDNFLTLDVQKELVKVADDFMRRDKQSMKRKQTLYEGTKIVRKGKEHEVDLFDQG